MQRDINLKKDYKKKKLDEKNIIRLIIFRLGNENYGVEIGKVQEVIIKPEITVVPRVMPYVDGIVNLRGQIFPVLDLRSRLGMARIDETDDTRIVIVNISEQYIGLVVDEVSEVVKVNKKLIDSSVKGIGSVNSKYAKSVANLEDTIVTILDLGKIISISPAEKKSYDKKLVDIGRANFLKFIQRNPE